MSFKIIKFKLNGYFRYEVVPSGWEANGFTWLPKNGLSTKQKLEDSLPESVGWFQTPSLLKKTLTVSFHQAMNELFEMLHYSSTEDEGEEETDDKHG